ncbi:methyltransferase family protein [Mycobacterium shigaense]|uniref:methyltransferase family protein n=1 Tax=Mycobacterium shigaense TaxID=722731 RepID=UPI000E575A91|nr:isoprenylcysteine carboxylmethyltransferase family protein [Mycobacterium shigaense]
MNTGIRIAASSVLGTATMAVILFAPARTLNYWQAWVFLAVFTAATLLPSIYLARTNPAALRRRIHAGPCAETRPAQKIIIVASFFSMVATMAFSALDHRFAWSPVPAWVCVLGDALVVVGLGVAQLVIVQNGYAAATITVEAGQTLTTDGLYGFVRHPMYAGDVVMMVGMPLALGSYWGLIFVIPGAVALVLRILDEEELLTSELPGYREYAQRVRYRLLPYAW